MTKHTLRALLDDLKIEAMHAGRYPTPVSAEQWESRDKSAAVRCIAYNDGVRRINALEDALAELDSTRRFEEIERLKTHIRRIFTHAADREMCDNTARGFALATIAGMCEEAIGPWCYNCEKIGCNHTARGADLPHSGNEVNDD